MLPIIPTDTFPRDMSEILNKPYKYVKTTFDLCCLTTTLVLSIGILHGLHGVGIGTVLCAFITGKTVSMFQKVLDDHVVFYRAVIRPTKPEISALYEGEIVDLCLSQLSDFIIAKNYV